MVTPTNWVITLCWRSGPIPAKWSAPVCGEGDHSVVWSISRRKPYAALGGPAPEAG